MRVMSFFIWLSLILAFPVNALVVDKMFIISDEKGNEIITLTNDDNQKSFISTTITEIKTDSNGKVIRIPYTKDNINDWKISTTNPKLILEPTRTKDVGIRSLCVTEECAGDKDLMFSISFEPAPYFDEGDEIPQGVRINYGYAPLYVIPTANGHIDYDITNRGNKLEVFNKGNTLIRLHVDMCRSNTDSNCEVLFNVVAGRHKTFELPETLQAETLNIEVSNFDESYKTKVNAKKIGS